jgi:hypothetical protein
LASGGINARASQLLADIADGLGYWVRVVCESRQLIPPKLGSGVTYGQPQAQWLAHHIASIAQFEDAGDIVSDVENWTRTIEQVVNRPIKFQPLGNCEVLVKHGESWKPCGSKLQAPTHVEIATFTVQCQGCDTRQSALRLMLGLIDKAVGEPLTWEQLKWVNSRQGENAVADRTLRRWKADGLITSRDGKYLWADVQMVKEIQKTGPKPKVTPFAIVN